MIIKKFGLFFALMLTALVLGCSGGDDDKGKGEKAAAAPDSPDGYVNFMIQSVADGKPNDFWQNMPGKYRDDVKGLVKDFGAKMDAEVWNKGFAVYGKVVQVLKTKREMVLASPLMAAVPPDVKANYDSIVRVIDTLVNSEIKTHDGLKSLDLDEFIAGTGNQLGSDLIKLAELAPNGTKELEEFRKTKVSTVKEDGDTATVKIEEEGKPAKEETVKKVDGRWVPAELASEWDGSMAKAKEELQKFAISPEDKTEVMKMMDRIDEALNKLLAANDQAAFDAALGETMSTIGPAMMGAGSQ